MILSAADFTLMSDRGRGLGGMIYFHISYHDDILCRLQEMMSSINVEQEQFMSIMTDMEQLSLLPASAATSHPHISAAATGQHQHNVLHATSSTSTAGAQGHLQSTSLSQDNPLASSLSASYPQSSNIHQENFIQCASNNPGHSSNPRFQNYTPPIALSNASSGVQPHPRSQTLMRPNAGNLEQQQSFLAKRGPISRQDATSTNTLQPELFHNQPSFNYPFPSMQGVSTSDTNLIPHGQSLYASSDIIFHPPSLTSDAGLPDKSSKYNPTVVPNYEQHSKHFQQKANNQFAMIETSVSSVTTNTSDATPALFARFGSSRSSNRGSDYSSSHSHTSTNAVYSFQSSGEHTPSSYPLSLNPLQSYQAKPDTVDATSPSLDCVDGLVMTPAQYLQHNGLSGDLYGNLNIPFDGSGDR